MSIIIGIVLPAILFLVTLPLKSLLFIYNNLLKSMTKGLGGSLSRELGLSKEFDIVKNSATAVEKAPIVAYTAGKTAVKGVYKGVKLTVKTVKHIIRFLQLVIGLIQLIIQGLIILATSGVLLVLVIIIAVVSATSGIIMFLNSEMSNITYGEVIVNESTDNNIVDSNVNSTGWVGTIEGMAKWYVANVPTYQGDTGGSGFGSRSFYPCDLVGGQSVGDDCSGFLYACLVYGGYVSDNPKSAPASSSYISGGNMISKLESAGFTHGSIADDTVFKAGDILAVSGHVEIVVGDNGDGTYQTFGWGTIQDSYPSTSKISCSSLINSYSDYFRLN